MIILKFDILNDSQWLQMFNKSELRYFTRLSETFGIIEIYSLQSNRSKMIFFFSFLNHSFSELSATTSGICVRLWNLPKKRNIHRDLQTAFKGFRGILHINPAIAGNKKTRDPICKGFAFVDLATEEAATR